MARFVYINDDDKVLELFYPCGEAPQTVTQDGVEYRRDYSMRQGASSDSMWPMNSAAAGVHPAQISEAMAHAEANGVPTSFTADGDAILTDKAHRKAYLNACGLHDRNAGYGDPTPKFKDSDFGENYA